MIHFLKLSISEGNRSLFERTSNAVNEEQIYYLTQNHIFEEKNMKY